MDIPGIGPVTKDDDGLYYSKPTSIPVLGGQMCRIVVEDYDDDSNKEDFHKAIKNFLSAGLGVLKAAEPYVYHYYKDCNSALDPGEDGYIVIGSATDIWAHVQFGDEPTVTRRAYGDKGIYVSLECNCDWEPEHGLQIVFKDGLEVNKVGQCDGHLTNSDAYDDEQLEHVIYQPL